MWLTVCLKKVSETVKHDCFNNLNAHFKGSKSEMLKVDYPRNYLSLNATLCRYLQIPLLSLKKTPHSFIFQCLILELYSLLCGRDV